VQLSAPVSSIKRWSLDPAIHHLNHGSYGGCPHAVTLTAAAWRARLEAAPMQFMVLDWQTELDRARAALAEFVHAPAERLVFVPSSTIGVAIALNSVELAAGDEILTTDHAYRACVNQLVRLADARGATIRAVTVPLPFDGDALVDAVTRAIGPRTRLALFDHITSATALRLPIERLTAACTGRGIPVVVDGAHAPGQIALDVAAIGATYYIGNCHKWLCAPKGTGFLVVSEAAPARPITTSHGASPEYGPANRLHAELDWSGTYDPAPNLTVASAIATLAVEGGGWPAIYARNHAVVCELRRQVVAGLGGTGAAQRLAADDALACMAAIPIQLAAGAEHAAVQLQLLREGWEVQLPIIPQGPLLRLSAHLYNSLADADLLVGKLRSLGVTAGALAPALR
jgi:isopenicillin-N epimerase